MQVSFQNTLRAVTLALLVATMAAALMLLPEIDPDQINVAVGRAGPAAIVLLVALGIVVSPIPSGAVAVVAGALYGTWWGGGLTILGAGLGASVAFALSRWLGRDVLAGSRSSAADFLTRHRSQNALMLTVFATRLIPFISFDAISYVAGLTPLAFWRFLLATLLGTTPVCLAFAAMGSAQSEMTNSTLVLVLVCGITLLVPLGGLAFRALKPIFGSRAFSI